MLWEIMRGDTDADIIDYIEADTQDEAEEIALDRHSPGWRDDIEAFVMKTMPCDIIYAREASPWKPEVKEWFAEKKVADCSRAEVGYTPMTRRRRFGIREKQR